MTEMSVEEWTAEYHAAYRATCAARAEVKRCVDEEERVLTELGGSVGAGMFLLTSVPWGAD